jgi:hypothetical protein
LCNSSEETHISVLAAKNRPAKHPTFDDVQTIFNDIRDCSIQLSTIHLA